MPPGNPGEKTYWLQKYTRYCSLQLVAKYKHKEEDRMGLGQYKVSGGFAVSDMESARGFYERKLGLPVGTDSGDNVSYRCGGLT